ncbi:MAG: ABC transporter permease [Coriobacteriales bacterium]|jgi:ABC-2 type transport system permease protein|nr:ABC transporter permease [Coriobacteriales bacterium]
MRKAFAVMLRILQQFSHDPRTIVLFVVAPVLVLWLFSALLNAPAYHPSIAAVDLPQEVTDALTAEEASVRAVDAAKAHRLLSKGDVDAVCVLEGTVLEVTVEGSNPSRTAAVASTLSTAVKTLSLAGRERAQSQITQHLSEAQGQFDALWGQLGTLRDQLEALRGQLAELPGLAELPNLPGLAELPNLPNPSELPILSDLSSLTVEFTPTVEEISLSYLHGTSEWGSFDFFGPVFIGIFIFMFVFITSGMSLVTERLGGTMERLLVTPIRPWQLVLGFCLGFGLVSLIQAAIVLWACIALIGFPNEGSLALVVMVTFSMALVSLCLGLLVSALAKTAFQVIQFMLVLVVPQILLSGVFDLTAAPEWMRVLSACFPITHGAEALRAVMLRGAGLEQVALDFGILWAFVAAFFLLATLSFSRRKTH